MFGLSNQTNAILRHVYTMLGTAAAILVYLGLSPDDVQKIIGAVHQIGDGVASVVAGLAVLVPIGSALFARWTAKPEQQQAAVEATGAVVVPASVASPAAMSGAKVSSHWLVGLLAVVLLLAVGACTITGSDGVGITVTPMNFVDVVVAKVKSECPVIKSIASTAVLVTPVVADLANKADAGKTAVQVEQAAADACTKITAATTATPAAASSSSDSSSSSSGAVTLPAVPLPAVTLPAVTVVAPAPTPAVPLPASSGG